MRICDCIEQSFSNLLKKCINGLSFQQDAMVTHSEQQSERA